MQQSNEQAKTCPKQLQKVKLLTIKKSNVID